LLRPRSLFDVEPYRARSVRHAASRQAGPPTLVLGSTQPAELIDQGAATERGIDVARRRGGGGAVFLPADGYLWVDAWVPRVDPLWDEDVTRAAAAVGAWWAAALVGLGLPAGSLEVHQGRPVPGPWGRLVCFAGRGPGELFLQGRKLMGLSQWRSKEGSLFSACVYARWDPEPLAALLAGDAAVPPPGVSDLVPLAVGLDDLVPPGPSLADLQTALLTSFPAWGRSHLPSPD
jgi:lipoate-protein ligase A